MSHISAPDPGPSFTSGTLVPMLIGSSYRTVQAIFRSVVKNFRER